MPYEFFDHTGDIGVRLRGASLDDLFEAGAEALAETLADRSRIQPLVSDVVTLEAPDVDMLLVDWLGELLYRFDVHGFLTARATVAIRADVEHWLLSATIAGERLDPGRHQIKVLLKAITHHALSVVRSEHGWEAKVVFDV